MPPSKPFKPFQARPLATGSLFPAKPVAAKPVTTRPVTTRPLVVPARPSPSVFNTPAEVLAHEIANEQAAALGRLGRRLETALGELRAFDCAHGRLDGGSLGAARQALVAAAGEALWMFAVQREACGLRDSRSLMRDYAVPAEVQERMGIFPP